MVAVKAPISDEELAKHKTRDNIWIAIHGNVYDVTDFIEEHPGGPEVLLEQAGMDASMAFDDIGHSDHAHDLLKNFLLAPLASAKVENLEELGSIRSSSLSNNTSTWGSKWIPVSIVGAVVAGLLVYHYSSR